VLGAVDKRGRIGVGSEPFGGSPDPRQEDDRVSAAGNPDPMKPPALGRYGTSGPGAGAGSQRPALPARGPAVPVPQPRSVLPQPTSSKSEPAPPQGSRQAKLLDRLREALRARHYSPRTEQTYCHWAIGRGRPGAQAAPLASCPHPAGGPGCPGPAGGGQVADGQPLVIKTSRPPWSIRMS
jgi:hypothetical protein